MASWLCVAAAVLVRVCCVSSWHVLGVICLRLLVVLHTQPVRDVKTVIPGLGNQGRLLLRTDISSS